MYPCVKNAHLYPVKPKFYVVKGWGIRRRKEGVWEDLGERGRGWRRMEGSEEGNGGEGGGERRGWRREAERKEESVLEGGEERKTEREEEKGVEGG